MSSTSSTAYQIKDNDIIMHEAEAPYVLRFRDIPDEDKPREKLLKAGVKNLSVAELMAVVLGVGTSKEDVLSMAKRVTKEYGEKALMNEYNPETLATALEIPLTKACQIIASFEIGRRYYAKQQGTVYIRQSKQAYDYLKDMGNLRKEQLRGLYLNSRYQVIHEEIISIGSLTANIVHPREVFQPALEHGAIAVILAHNHPSGRVNPSHADLAITQQLVKAGEILGIDVVDHLIITATRHVSLLQSISD
jgi:DNA repair protein RadC